VFNRSTDTKDRSIARQHRIWTHSGSFGLNPNATPPQEVDASIVRNPE
jgi:hypothetical protein